MSRKGIVRRFTPVLTNFCILPMTLSVSSKVKLSRAAAYWIFLPPIVSFMKLIDFLMLPGEIPNMSQPSASSDMSSFVLGEAPPTQIGGQGFCIGLGFLVTLSIRQWESQSL